jgi:Tfp pilus assembly protein PilV
MLRHTTTQAGFSTLEMMIAMSVMVITLSAVVLTSFGTQGMLIGGETNAEAMKRAQALLENVQQQARKDFNLVNPVPETVDGIYTTSVEVTPWNLDPYTTKKVTVFVTWTDDKHVPRSLKLTTLLTNFTQAVGANTCSSALFGNWTTPQKTDYQFDSTSLLSGTGITGSYTIGDIDVYQGKLFTVMSGTSVNTSPTFFVLSTTSPSGKPQYLGSVDNSSTVSGGLNAVAVAGDYAYIANGYGANFWNGTTGCLSGPSCAQLQIIDVKPTSPTYLQVRANFLVPTSTLAIAHVTGTGGQAVGTSIFYHDGVIYLGLTKTATGPEFNIIDVHQFLSDPAHGKPVWLGGYTVGAAVNDISMRGKYAYLATPNQELITLDISNPLSPVVTGGYDAPDASGNGKRLALVGDRLYLGRTVTAANPELYLLNNTNPGVLLPAPLGTKEISSSVNGLVIRDYLAFVLTSTSRQFQIWNIKTPASITSYAPALSMPGDGSALDCEGNYLYAATNNGSTGFLSVIKAGP